MHSLHSLQLTTIHNTYVCTVYTKQFRIHCKTRIAIAASTNPGCSRPSNLTFFVAMVRAKSSSPRSRATLEKGISLLLNNDQLIRWDWSEEMAAVHVRTGVRWRDLCSVHVGGCVNLVSGLKKTHPKMAALHMHLWLQ